MGLLHDNLWQIYGHKFNMLHRYEHDSSSTVLAHLCHNNVHLATFLQYVSCTYRYIGH